MMEVKAKALNRQTNAQFERSWTSFLEHSTNHSASATFLVHIINRCERERIPYVLTAHPGQGYYIKPGVEI